MRASLKPDQWERLIQIQFQAQGPLAFTVRERGTGSADGRFVGPRLSEYLKMSDDQLNRAQRSPRRAAPRSVRRLRSGSP